MRLIPGIDLWAGQVVRLWQGDFAQRQVVAESPLHIGERFLRWGLRRWHLVDLEGAQKGTLQQKALLLELRQRFPQVEMSLGGGVRTEADVAWALGAGFDWVVVGSAAVLEPHQVQRWMEKWGPHRFILASDIREGQVVVHGWQEQAPLSAQAFLAAWQAKAPAAFLCTQVERDGTLSGPNVELYREWQRVAHPVPVVASGGIRGPEDLEALAQAGLVAAIVGKALYTDPTASAWVPRYAG